MRKLLALALISLAIAGLLEYLPQAVALVEGRVNNSSYYTVTDTDGIVYCRVLREVHIKKGRDVARTSPIQCQSRFPDQVNLTVTVHRIDATLASALAFSPASQTISLNYTDANLCRPLSFQALANNNGSGRIQFKVVSTGNFAVELYFQVNYVVDNGSVIDGCP